jgi:hypothetical protein
VTPGQFFALKFDFSLGDRSSNVEEAGQFLKDSINQSLETFYETYSTYLGEGANKLCKSLIPEKPICNLTRCVRLVQKVLKSGNEQLTGVQGIYLLVDEYDTFTNEFLELNNSAYDGGAVEEVFKSFWRAIKSLLSPNGIQRVFVTGIAPLSLADLGSGFNVATNVSSDEDMAGLCGLTRADIEASLEALCGSDAHKKHLQAMTTYLNGYHFCNQKTLEPIYNTETCLAYLQRLKQGKIPEARAPANSEVSQQFLRRISASPSALEDFETGLRRDERGDFVPFAYDTLKQDFTLTDLKRDVEYSRSAWRSLMLCYGGFTFDPKDPAHHLKIPNLVAAERIASAVLEKYELRETLNSALKGLEIDGDMRPLLRCYRKLMVQRDVDENDFQKSEEIHRDSFFFSLLRNPSLGPQVEFELIKPNRTPGRADIVLPIGNHLIVMEWKVIPIDFLDIPIPRQRSKKFTGATEPSRELIMRNKRKKKASVLSTYSLNKILGINFGKNDKFRVGELKKWIIDEAAPQLKSQIMSEEVQKQLKGLSLKASIVILIGSRQIVIWDMDADGNLVGEPDLVC